MDLFSFTECAKRTQSLQALFDLLVNCASELGFSAVAYGALNFVEPLRLTQYPPPAVITNFPRDWCQRYFERKYHAIDPVVRRTPMLSGPVLWDQLGHQFQLRACEQRVLDEAREAGLKRGISVPLFGPLGRVSVASFASQFDDADPHHCTRQLYVLAWNFHVALAEIARPPDRSCVTKNILSEREKDCLRWVAEGKSSWEIAMMLKVRENAVNSLLKNAMRKLCSANRSHGIAKAPQTKRV